MDIEPKLLRYFLMVAEELHFGRAATKLFVSQSALSEGIHRLETSLGVRLFSREKRRIELTPEGKVLQLQAPQILDQIRLAMASVTSMARDNAKRFRLGYSPFLNLHKVLELHSRLAEQSAWDIELVSAKTVDLTEQLLQGQISAALLIGPLDDRKIHCQRVFDESFIVGLPHDHHLSCGEGVEFQDLGAENVIWIPRSFHPAFYDRFVAACGARAYRPHFTFEVTTIQESLLLISDHRGITFSTRSAQALNHPSVVFRSLLEPLSVDTLAAQRSGERSSLLTSFAELAQEVFASSRN